MVKFLLKAAAATAVIAASLWSGAAYQNNLTVRLAPRTAITLIQVVGCKGPVGAAVVTADGKVHDLPDLPLAALAKLLQPRGVEQLTLCEDTSTAT